MVEERRLANVRIWLGVKMTYCKVCQPQMRKLRMLQGVAESLYVWFALESTRIR